MVSAGMLYVGGNSFVTIALSVDFFKRISLVLYGRGITDTYLGFTLAVLFILLSIAYLLSLCMTIFTNPGLTKKVQSKFSSTCSACSFSHRCKPDSDMRTFCWVCENVQDLQRHCTFCKFCLKKPSVHSTLAGICIGIPNAMAYITTNVLMMGILLVLLWALCEVGSLDTKMSGMVVVAAQVFLYQIGRSYFFVIGKVKPTKTAQKK